MLLRPVPYPEPDRLALLTTVARQNGAENIEYLADRRPVRGSARRSYLPGSRRLFRMFGGVNFAGEGRLEFVQQQRVSAGYFRVLGVSRSMGGSSDARKMPRTEPPLRY